MTVGAYRTLLEQLPPGTAVTVTREELLELLGHPGCDPRPAGERLVDYTTREAGQAFGKAPSTVRLWCERGELPGAYLVRGKEWRIPAAAIRAKQEREADAYREGREREAATGTSEPVSLDAWRRATSPCAGGGAGRAGASG